MMMGSIRFASACAAVLRTSSFGFWLRVSSASVTAGPSRPASASAAAGDVGRLPPVCPPLVVKRSVGVGRPVGPVLRHDSRGARGGWSVSDDGDGQLQERPGGVVQAPLAVSGDFEAFHSAVDGSMRSPGSALDGAKDPHSSSSSGESPEKAFPCVTFKPPR